MNTDRRSYDHPAYSVRWTIPQAFGAAFVAVYFGAAVLWSFPSRHPAWNGLKEDLARPVLRVLGAYQNWSMFAPDPIRIRRSVEARLIWADGSMETISFPESRHGNILERARGEQFRKWSLDQIRLDRNRAHWQGAAGRFAREAAKRRPDGLPRLQRVELIRRWSDEIRPGQPATWNGPLNHDHVFYRLEGDTLAEELRR